MSLHPALYPRIARMQMAIVFRNAGKASFSRNFFLPSRWGRRWSTGWPSQVLHMMEDGDPEGYPSMLDCPYVAGATLPMTFFPEGLPEHSSGYPITVKIENPLLPFTSAQALLVSAVSTALPDMPERLVFKLQDRRFRRTLAWDAAYDPKLDFPMRKGLFGILHEGQRPNPFSELGGDDDEMPSPGEVPWMDHVNDWLMGQVCFDTEVIAYRCLLALQGRIIPRMYGTVRYDIRQPSDILDPLNFTHPALDSVDGLALEYIDGATLNSFKLGVNITEDEADRVSQGTYAALREFKALRVCHNDIRLANIMVPKGDFDHPIIIDLAELIVKSPERDHEEWANCLPYAPVYRMRNLIAEAGLHMPSPYPSLCREDPLWGFGFFNRAVNRLRADWRDKLFEPVEPDGPERITVDIDGKEYTWEPARWRPKPGIKYAPDSDFEKL